MSSVEENVMANMKDYTNEERLLIIENYINSFEKRIDSYHHDVKAGDGRIEKKIEKAQEEILKDVKLIFVEESRKLSTGLIKQIDAVREEHHEIKQELTAIKAFVKGAKWMLGLIMSALTYLGIKAI
jgi:molecular chaperone GrpE (heat shock protein)